MVGGVVLVGWRSVYPRACSSYLLHPGVERRGAVDVRWSSCAVFSWCRGGVANGRPFPALFSPCGVCFVLLFSTPSRRATRGGGSWVLLEGGRVACVSRCLRPKSSCSLRDRPCTLLGDRRFFVPDRVRPRGIRVAIDPRRKLMILEPQRHRLPAWVPQERSGQVIRRNRSCAAGIHGAGDGVIMPEIAGGSGRGGSRSAVPVLNLLAGGTPGGVASPLVCHPATSHVF